MKQKKEQGLKNRALKQITILFAIAIVMAVLFSIAVLYSRTIKEHASFAGEHLNNVTAYLSTYLDEVDAIANDANYNYYLQNYLIDALENEKKYAEPSNVKKIREYTVSSQAFSDTFLTRQDISSIIVYGKTEPLFYKTLHSYRSVLMDYSELPWYKKARENPQKMVVTGPNIHDFLVNDGEKTISLSRGIQSYIDGSFLGVILIDLNLNEITQICESSQGDQDSFLCILNEEGELVYEQAKGKKRMNLESEEYLASVQKAMAEADENNFRMEVGAVNYFVAKSTMANTGWTVLSIHPYASILSGLKVSSILMIFSVGFLLVLTLVELNHILTGIVKPIKKLQSHMAKVSLDNMNEQQVSIQSNDEIGALAQNFNEMLERIKNLNEQMVLEQEEKRQYEFQALQAQINPHFLYNTLDSIIWMAETNDPNIVPMTEALAKLFRISLNKGNEEITVKKEIEHVRNYLFIQSMRYVDKFTYDIQVEEEVEKCRIIKLILQPVVENCIYHGIKKKRGGGHIRIHAYREGAFLKMTVSDDGCGMEPGMCEKILSDEVELENISGSGIGVKNVNERIKLRFGKDYGLKYESELGSGTTVTYTLPYCAGEGRP